MMIMGNIKEFFFGLWTELRSRTHLTCESFHFSKELTNLTRSDAAQTSLSLNKSPEGNFFKLLHIYEWEVGFTNGVD